MRSATSPLAKELLHEIKATPEEYLPALLEVVRGFRHGIILKPAEESIRQGMKEALAGETLPISELWKGIDAH
jgi:hypothetical protein